MLPPALVCGDCAGPGSPDPIQPWQLWLVCGNAFLSSEGRLLAGNRVTKVTSEGLLQRVQEARARRGLRAGPRRLLDQHGLGEGAAGVAILAEAGAELTLVGPPHSKVTMKEGSGDRQQP